MQKINIEKGADINVQPNEASKTLSIVIPTYNRSKFLSECLYALISELGEYSIEICISDNASDDDTQIVVENISKEYKFIRYSKNKFNCGPSNNIAIALEMARSKYIWLFGDTYTIPKGSIKKILGLVQNNDIYSAIILNRKNDPSLIPTKDYNDPNELLSELGWTSTCLATLIYRKDLINKEILDRYMSTYFPQTGLIFEAAYKKDFLLHWESNIKIDGLRIPGYQKISWQKKIIDVWIRDWIGFVFSLPPAYSMDAKKKCALDHAKYTKILNTKSLLHLRSIGIFRPSVFYEHKNQFKYALKYPLIFLFIIAHFPMPLAKFIGNSWMIFDKLKLFISIGLRRFTLSTTK